MLKKPLKKTRAGEEISAGFCSPVGIFCRSCLALLMVLAVLWGETAMADPKSQFPPSYSKVKGLDIGDPIAASSGAYHFTMPLLDLGGPLPLCYSLHYRMDEYHDCTSLSILGPFEHNLNPAVYYAVDELLIYLRNGDRPCFTTDEVSGEWVLDAVSPVRYRLQETGSTESNGFYYVLDPIEELVYIFDKSESASAYWYRRVLFVVDRNNNRLTYTYDDAPDPLRPTRVADGLGRSLSMDYNSYVYDTSTYTLLTSVTDQAGRTITFGHGDSEKWSAMNSITDPEGNTTEFVYDGADNLKYSGSITQVIRPLRNVPYRQTVAKEKLNGASYSPRVTSQTDAYENTTTLTYDEGTNRVTETQPDTKTVVYQHYDNDGVPQKLTDPANRTAEFEKTVNEQLSSVTDRLGDSTAISYHAETGKISSITNAKGHTITRTYTAQDQTFINPANEEEVTFTFYNLTRVDYPDGTNEQFTYDGNGNMLTCADQTGATWTCTYNTRGQVLTQINPVGGVTTFAYNDDATVASTTDSDTGTTTYGYDTYKRLSSITHPDDTSVQMAYNLNDQITSVTDENGHICTYTYDANGNLTGITDPAGKTTQYAYDLMDRVEGITDRLGKRTDMTYDNMNRVESHTDPNGIRTTFGYDARGWLTQTTLGDQTWQTGYDDEGVVSSHTTPLGNTTTFNTDELGYTTGITDPLSRMVSLTRDSMTRVAGVTDPLSRTTSYSYDARGLLSGVTVPVIGTATYIRNDIGLVTRITDLNGSDWTFDYTTMGRLQASTDPSGNTWQHTYDTCGRLKQTTCPDGITHTRTYDGAGNLTRRQYSDGTDLQFTYDACDRLMTANGVTLTCNAEGHITNTENPGTDFGATYDDGGNLKTVTYNNGLFTVTYTYDAATGLLSRVADDLTGTQLNFAYDHDRRLVGITRPNGVNAVYRYDGSSRITGIQDGSVIDLQYTLNDAGEVTRVSGTMPLEPYDFLEVHSASYTYDATGQVSSQGFEYDGRGRLMASPGMTCAWDGASRLVGVNDVTLAYNGLGDLITRTDGASTIHYYYNYAIGLHPVTAEKDEGTGQFLRYYVWTPGGELLYMIDAAEDNKVFFYHFDRTGSTLALTDSTGAVTDSYVYTPYGTLLGHSGTSTQPFTFIGKQGVRQEGSSGTLYHMRARYYDAETRRFLSRDPVWPQVYDAQELIPYQYARTNPLTWQDPSGLFRTDESLWFAGAGKNQGAGLTGKGLLDAADLGKKGTALIKTTKRIYKGIKTVRAVKGSSTGLKAFIMTLKTANMRAKTQGGAAGLVIGGILDTAIAAERIYQMADAHRNSVRVGEENKFVWYDPLTWVGNRAGKLFGDWWYKKEDEKYRGRSYDESIVGNHVSIAKVMRLVKKRDPAALKLLQSREARRIYHLLLQERYHISPLGGQYGVQYMIP